MSKILLFDGVCNLCSSAVQFIIQRDQKNRFRFASLQSKTGKLLIEKYHVVLPETQSLVLIDDGKAYTQSAASLRAARYLSGAWPLLYAFIIVPRFIRNGVYKWVAKNRYKWFGKKQECWIPKMEWKQKFLDQDEELSSR